MNRTELLTQIRDFFPPEVVETVMALVVSHIGMVPLDTDTAIGGSRFGGTPDMPASMEWPHSDWASLDWVSPAGTTLSSGNVPMAFVAQIDLAEAHTLGDIAKDLPETGRLLFFLDVGLWRYENAIRAGKVIWDNSPVEQLQPVKTPEILRELEKQEQEQYAKTTRDMGLNPEKDSYNPGYIAPAQPVRLVEDWALMDAFTVELRQSIDLDALKVSNIEGWDDGTPLYDLYTWFEPEDQDGDDNTRGYTEHRLLGHPLPVQDDPRYEPAYFDFLEGRKATHELLKDFYDNHWQEAQNWRLLLQVDNARWLQTNTEGTYYFLIRDTDLKAQKFDQVWVVYQQT